MVIHERKHDVDAIGFIRIVYGVFISKLPLITIPVYHSADTLPVRPYRTRGEVLELRLNLVLDYPDTATRVKYTFRIQIL